MGRQNYSAPPATLFTYILYCPRPRSQPSCKTWPEAIARVITRFSTTLLKIFACYFGISCIGKNGFLIWTPEALFQFLIKKWQVKYTKYLTWDKICARANTSFILAWSLVTICTPMVFMSSDSASYSRVVKGARRSHVAGVTGYTLTLHSHLLTISRILYLYNVHGEYYWKFWSMFCVCLELKLC